jgi:hypothetical protein
MMKYRVLLAGVGIFLLAIAADAQFPGGGGQPGGFGGGTPGGGFGGRGGGMGGGMRDPSVFFKMLSGGKDTINMDALDERSRMMMDGMSRRYGITMPTGTINQDQFSQLMKQVEEKRAAGGAAGPGSPGGAPGAAAPAATAPGGMIGPGGGGMGRGNWGGAPGGWGGAPGGFGGGAPDWSGGGADAFAESRFRRADKNNDGVLEAEEMDEALLAEKDKWDTNQDGVIDLQEYKAYFAARMKQIQAEREKMNPFGPAHDDEDGDKKPTVHRSGKLPKDLPTWFTQLDTDGDLQIGLYEWKVSKRPIKEFRDMDRNGDNFLTIDEVLYYVRAHTPNNGTAVASTGGPAGPGAQAGAFGGPGAFNMMNGNGGQMRFQMPGFGTGMPGADPNGGGRGMGRGGMFPGGGMPTMGDRSGTPGGDRTLGGGRNRGDRSNGPGGAGSDANPKDKGGNGPGGMNGYGGGRQKGMGKGGYQKGGGD